MRNRITTGRNPFARESITRRRVCDTCDWCGSSRTNPRTHAPYVFVYHVSLDSGRERDIPGHFCGVDCLRSYYA